ncbi:hypothetical protein [Rubrimonas sp.]|uniref:hypothetical protein n=1 Tax=Rubrimonas sp. TaxID=2036015 RepID=UPI002FDEEB3C
MKVMIATPTVHGTVAAAYARTLVALTQVLGGFGAGYTLMTVDNADVVTARNLLAHAFMQDDSLSHLLFVDSDMAVQPVVMRRLFALRAPVVGVAYPQRRIDLAAFAQAIREGAGVEQAKARASVFTLRLSPGARQIRDDVMEVEGFGFGFVVIEKALMRRLAEAGLAQAVSRRRSGPSEPAGAIRDYFSEITLANGERLAEDHAFCERVLRLGDTRLLAYVGPGVGHVGQFTHDASFVDRVRATSSGAGPSPAK